MKELMNKLKQNRKLFRMVTNYIDSNDPLVVDALKKYEALQQKLHGMNTKEIFVLKQSELLNMIEATIEAGQDLYAKILNALCNEIPQTFDDMQ